MNEFVRKVIAHIVDSRYISNVDKYLVKLAFFDEKSKEYWLTPRQYFQLLENFDRTPKEYSTKKYSVVGYFNKKGYFVFSRFEYRKEQREFEEPHQYDLSNLQEDE